MEFPEDTMMSIAVAYLFASKMSIDHIYSVVLRSKSFSFCFYLSFIIKNRSSILDDVVWFEYILLRAVWGIVQYLFTSIIEK